MKDVHERLSEMEIVRIDDRMCGRERETGKWFFIDPPAGWKETEATAAEAERLEGIFQDYDEYCERMREEKYGPRPARNWDYLAYLDECERVEGRKMYPAGNIDPNDAFHETGAHTPG